MYKTRSQSRRARDLFYCKKEIDGQNLSGISNDTDAMENVVVKQEDSLFGIEIMLDVDVASNDEHIYCNECNQDYKGYCLKCSPVSHFLNNTTINLELNTKVMPNDVIEIRDAIDGNGVFALKTLPKNVIFGPSGSLSAIESNNGWKWKTKNKKLVNVEDGSWMQHVNYTDSASSNNIEIFQFNGCLYLQTNREIYEGEELLVYYREEEIQNSNCNEESYYIPIKQEKSQEVFACTLCHLGFSADKHLIAHKIKCLHSAPHNNVTDMIQCCHCDIWLEKQEYLEYHADFCKDNNLRKYSFPAIISRRKTVTQMDVEETEGEFPQELDSKNEDFIKINNKFQCFHCDYEANYKSSLERHIKSKHMVKKAYKCTVCSFETIYRSCYNRHIKYKHRIGKKYECKQCDYKTNKKYYIEKHIKNKHTLVKDYKCLKCRFATNYKHSLQKHIKVKHAEKMEKNFQCANCSYDTNRKSQLVKHIKYNHSSKKEKCQYCSFVTNRGPSLKKHINDEHRIENNFKCPQCDYQTKRKYSLKVHMRNAHPVGTKKDFKCTECSYETNYKFLLRQHMDRHNNKYIKPPRNIKCPQCSFVTNQKIILKEHFKYKHGDGVAKNIICSQCAFKTNKICILKGHIENKHTPIIKKAKCSQCDFETKRKNTLQQHIKYKHTANLPKRHKCCDCSYETHYKWHLGQHIKSHHSSGLPKEFKCTLCSYETNRKGDMKTHIQNTHKVINCANFDFGLPKSFKCFQCLYETPRKGDMKKHIQNIHKVIVGKDFNFEVLTNNLDSSALDSKSESLTCMPSLK